MNKFFKNFTFDLLWLWLCLFIVISSLFYYIYQTNIYTLVLSLILSYWPIKWLIKEKTQETKRLNLKFKENKLIFIFFLLFWLLSLIILFFFQTDKSIISPWELIPNYFFFIFFLTIFLALVFLKNHKNSLYSKICLFLIYLLSFSVAIIVYKIGYGYDPFIHQASIYHIIENGFILPKNLYYIGQYHLIIAFNQLFAIPIEFSNKVIVPFLAALVIPIFSFKFLNKIVINEKEKNNISLTIALLLMLGFSIFIVSTPQSLAYIFLLATIIFNLNKQSFPYAFFSSLASFFIHPIAGIPAILFTFVFLSKTLFKKTLYQKIFTNLIIFSSIFLMPLSLVIGAKASFNWQINLSNFQFFYLNQENIFLNFSYFFINNYYLFLFIFIVIALIYLRKTSYFRTINNNFKMAIALFISAFFSFFLNWQGLIHYEQSDYARRLIIMAIIFLFPIIALFLIKISEKIKRRNFLIYLIFLSFLITVSFYASYPRDDNYHNSRAFSVSNTDLRAVEILDNWADSEYIVLANQQVGVAALMRFGFDNYLESEFGPIFFYSIPTGGLLYQDYLKMVYEEPSYANIKKAMDLVSVNQAFLVVNKYWWASEKIIKEAKISANDYREINDANIFIFKYNK
jgi:hypothetical protein